MLFILQGLLHYHITNPNIPLSEIFGQMKVIKENYRAIEDYTTSENKIDLLNLKNCIFTIIKIFK